jgi:hypothetical protein
MCCEKGMKTTLLDWEPWQPMGPVETYFKSRHLLGLPLVRKSRGLTFA